MINAPDTSGSTEMYFEEIRGIDQIPHEELMELIDRAQAGDKKAREKVTEANQLLVVKIAKQYLRAAGELSLLDLVQEGNIGLVETIDRFDTARGIRFSTYASQWIRHYIMAAISDKSRTIALKRGGYKQVHAAQKQRKELERALGREPSETELKEKLMESGSRATTVDNTLNAARMRIAPLHGTGASDEMTMEGRLADPNVPDTGNLIDATRAPGIDEILSVLPERERVILTLRFTEGLSLAAIGRKLKLSRERARQIQEQALESLRDRMGENLSELFDVYEYRVAS